MTQTRYTDKESRATAKQPVFLPRLRMCASCQRERSELRVKTEVTVRFDTKSFRYEVLSIQVYLVEL